MCFNIYFCNDGILRGQLNESSPKIPIFYLQNKLNLNDLNFWSSWGKYKTSFEEGLTIKTFIDCLEPWQDFLSHFLNVDMRSYIEESRKENCDVNLKKVNQPNLSWINLSYCTTIEPEIQYDKNIDNKTDIIQWLNSPKKISLTGNWNMHGKYSLTGYKLNEIEHYSVEHTPLNELADIPLHLSKEHIIYFSDFFLNKILPEENGIFNENSFGVRCASDKNNKDDKNKLKYLKAKKEHTFFEVLHGFWDWMSYSPIQRDELNAQLEKSLKEVELLHDNLSNEEVSNIIEDSNEIESDENIESFKSDYDKKQDFWNSLVKELENKKNILRTGEIKESIPLENRVFLYLVEEKDLSTPYKKLSS